MSTLLVLLFFAFLTLISYFFSLKYYWLKKNVHSLSIFSIIGTLKMLTLQMSIGDFLWNAYNRTENKLVGFHIGATPSVLLKDVNLIKTILVKDFENFNHRTVATNYEGDPLGTKMMFALRNPSWRLMRKSFSATFTTGKIRRMYPNLNKVGDNLVDFIKTHENRKLDAKEMFHTFSTDVITANALGIEANSFMDNDAISRTFTKKIFPCNLWRGIQFISYFVLPNLVEKFNMKFIDLEGSGFVVKMIEEIKRIRNRDDTNIDDFVGKILELDKKQIYIQDKNEIYAQALQFWVAGFETIGSSLMFLFHELAHHPEIQEKLREEIQTTLLDNDGYISYNTIRRMTYLNMVTEGILRNRLIISYYSIISIFLETYRKYPVLPFLDRVCLNDYQIPNTNITIDRGTNVYISIQGVNYDPNNFSHPNKFDPERFNSANIKDNLLNITFGQGPRHCIGLRFGKAAILVGVIKILSKFRVVPVDKYKDMEFDGRIFLLSPRKSIYLKFESL
ncbi:cytochrome P450 6k1-like isoform X1 [Onthophagus taurus]|uniref:cytochrome P450 6k1-like isoform X1 n=1 Tax=Onthophagus taurus TaxID=166361 RepID=UPI0039BDB645